MPKEISKVTVALVFMNNNEDNFFIENPPQGAPSKWIDRFVDSVYDVEHVIVYELGERTRSWSNPDSSPELPFT